MNQVGETLAAPPETARSRVVRASRWTALAWASTVVVLLTVSLAVARNPVQVTDSLVPMLKVQELSPWQVLAGKSESGGFFRPLRFVQIKLLLDGSAGHYNLAYKSFHLLFIAALFFLFARIARVQTSHDALAFVFALMVLTGMNTFLGMVWEEYAINHFIEIAVFSIAALVLCQSRGGIVVDAAAAVLFVVATLTLDSGPLVWVVVVTARVVGLRGVSRRGVAVMTALLAAYVVYRFALVHIGAPEAGERATGFGFSRIEPDEIERRFVQTGRLSYFHLYNVVCAFVSIFLSEPVDGRWQLTGRMVSGGVDPKVVINIVSALVATGLLAAFAVRRRAAWMARRFETADQLVIICVVMALANAAMCFSYVKDDIMSTAGIFYALAVFAVTSDTLTRWSATRRSTVATAVLAAVLFAGGAAWTLRTVGLQYQMVRIGTSIRYEWAHVDEWLVQQNQVPATAEGQRLVRDLQAEAMRARPLSLLFVPRWTVKWLRIE